MSTGDSAQHAQSMDRMYRLTRHVYDASRKYFLLGRDRMVQELAVPAGGSVLEMGCGTGRNLIAVARRYGDCRLHGVDISSEMLATASNQIARAGLGARVLLSKGDATAFDAVQAFGRETFDRVYFSYSLSMIPDWQGALRQALALTAADGTLTVVDFADFRGWPRGFGRVMNAWLARFHVTPRLELAACLEALGADDGRRLRFSHPSGGYVAYGTLGPAAEEGTGG